MGSTLNARTPAQRDRNPTIYRIAFFRHRPPALERARLWDELRGMLPDRPGVDADLTLLSMVERTGPAPTELSENPAASAEVARPQPDEVPTTSNNRPSAMLTAPRILLRLFLGLIGLAGVACFFVWFGGFGDWPFGRVTSPPKDDWDSTVKRMANLLSSKWQDSDTRHGNPKLDMELVNRFFALLSQEHLHDKLVGEHPDVKFLLRLPEVPLYQLKTPAAGTSKELADLRNAIEKLLAKSGAPTQGKPMRDMLNEIDQMMDYQLWWDRQSESLLKHLITCKAVNQEVWEKACRFCRRDSSTDWQCTPAQAMATSLKNWGVKGLTNDDATKRPWFVFAAYFYFLSRQDLPSPETLTGDDPAHAQWAEEHLPEKPYRPTNRFEAPSKLNEQLKLLFLKLKNKVGIEAPADGLVIAIEGAAGSKEDRAFLLNSRKGPRLPNKD